MSVDESSTCYPEVPCLLWCDRQAGAAIGMSVKIVQELARAGLLPGLKIGRTWRFDPDAIRSWIKTSGESQQVQCIAGAARGKQIWSI
jgi:hypothetical protein